ncbi:hypothetical protein ACI5KX_08240 [Erythrobacter sp. GH1-10]|uniref:hypothetical protein n=1 Tax=Erythrobacter sp. GH1-10 TaxID=3349334 RepID=UPI003878023F
MIRTWPCPLPGGKTSEELVVSHGPDEGTIVLVIPPLFDEHNKMRRQLVEVMRRLSEAGIGTRLPDLPGWNESTRPLANQSLAHWREAIREAARIHDATRFLAVRSGALIAPSEIKGWLYAPQSGPKLLRAMIRARVIASREAGTTETSEKLNELGRTAGVTLAGWYIGPELFRELETAEIRESSDHVGISQQLIGGPPLWLRAEPAEDQVQADSLATAILEELAAPE